MNGGDYETLANHIGAVGSVACILWWARIAMKKTVSMLVSNAIGGAIVYANFVCVFWVFFRQWPPQYVLISASIGGALSPFLWKAIRGVWPNDPHMQ